MQSDLGPSLIVLGIAISLLGILQPNLAPLLALGLASLSAGLLATWEPAARERIIAKLGEAGWENTSALIQAAGLPPKAYYLPSSAAGRPVAVVARSQPREIPQRALAFTAEGGPALVLSTPGTKALEICGVGLPRDLGEALRACAVNALGLARSVEVAERGDGNIAVEFGGVAAPDLYGRLLVRPAIGSVLASIAAAIAAEVLGRAVEIVEERAEGRGRLLVVLR
ncbi:hypothetical protein TUZN_0031 [Thermoproteus uzoniensis 768-20]|uniref:Uncharacterized protein n=1 Tax=Thermoproteus uzoniensis (strain 768-20) TaxID=999630 RepID=F2L0Y8_THEU7|nr:hypothetical protein [Thermoproteus uzoniensis]AEA11537.1 hypothetical protein TUZN_0031 [Thermoproteus uzoniensis 768-20]